MTDGRRACVEVGVLGSHRRARVDARGRVEPDGAGLVLDWWIGADDRWHLAGDDDAVRQTRLGAAPITETAMRVPGGDAVQRVYGSGGPGDLVAIEVENRSPAPFVVAFVLRGALGGLTVDGAAVRVGGRVALLLPRRPARVAVGTRNGDVRDIVCRGDASIELPAYVRGTREAAFLLPVAHRTTLRAALALARVPVTDVDLASAPTGAHAARGWTAQLERGMQVVLPDDARQREVDAARADLLLSAATREPGADVFIALEDWGLDAEAATAWHRLGWRQRRAAARRRTPGSEASAPALLRETRDRLVRERSDGTIELAPAFRAEWRGRPLEVHDAPIRAGTVSYAIRWHGPRPALFWELRALGAPPVVYAPALDPAWSSTETTGEALLGA